MPNAECRIAQRVDFLLNNSDLDQNNLQEWDRYAMFHYLSVSNTIESWIYKEGARLGIASRLSLYIL